MVQNSIFNSGDDGLPPTERGAARTAQEQRNPDFFMARLAPATLAALNETQQADVRAAIAAALPQPQPKIVDFRFVINLLFDRYYVVLFMGKDLRRKARSQSTWLTRLSNLAIALLLLLSLNLFISLTLGMVMYLVKSALGIDLFPGHLSDRVESL